MPGAARAKKIGAGRPKLAGSGRLRIGDDWNAITIIALSQDNPLKAIAEFVENSIDAGAKNVLITRARERGEHFLTVADDGEGVRRNDEGVPDFRYVATHICDSIKRQLKSGGLKGIQGEFGIGLLSFWTVGAALAMSSGGADGAVHQMHMRKGDPGYEITRRPVLAAEPGTRLKIGPLLPGVRQVSGEKIQWYLAAELRERIRQAKVSIRVIDRIARKEFKVEPRQFTGDLVHQLPAVTAPQGEAYAELYLNPPEAANEVGLYRAGTRILGSLAELDAFRKPPWTDGYLQGIVDAPYLNLTPATRTGVIHDAALEAFATALAPLEARLRELIAEHRRAEEERMSRDTLRAIQRAFREALLTLPSEEYEWFDISALQRGGSGGTTAPGGDAQPEGVAVALAGDKAASPRQKEFFEYAGPLHNVRIVPATCTLAVGSTRTLRALARDSNRRALESGVEFAWRILDGAGQIDGAAGEIATYTAPAEPCLVRLGVDARQGDTLCEAEALITVTDTFLPEEKSRSAERQGLPGYTLEHAPGKLWRSRFDAEQNVIVVNSGHRDYIYAARAKALKLRYLVRLYAKEMVQKNFPGLPSGELLDRLIELSLYTEENLR